MSLNAKLLPILAFFAFLIKTIVISPSIPDSVIILGLIAYIVADNYRFKDKKIEEFSQSLENCKQIIEKQALDIRNLQSKVSSVSLAQGMRPMIKQNTNNG